MSTSVLPPPSAPMTDSASMLASVGPDFLAGASDIPIPVSEGSEDIGSDDTPVEVSADTPVEEPVSEPVAEPAELPEEPVQTKTDAPPADTTLPEELEEGIIKVKDKEGKYKYRLDENRYKTIYDTYKAAREITDAWGEPMTVEAAKLRNEALLAQERLFDHITSGEPERQADVLNFMIGEMKAAQADGETGVDPTIPFAETVYSTLRDQAPDAYAHLRLQAARDLVGELFNLAASTKNNDLFSGLQHVSATLAGIGPKPADMSDAQYAAHIREVAGRSNIPFHTMQEMQGLAQGEDPTAALARENAELRARLNGNNGPNSSAEQYQRWDRAHAQSVNAAIFEDAVKPALSSVANSWKDFPEDYQRLVVAPLNNEVTKVLSNDQMLSQQVTELRQRASRATSEAVRQRVGDQIRQLFVNRAMLATEKVKGPILKFAAEALKGQSAQTNGRRTAAQARTVPGGTSAPVKNSVLPNNFGGFKNNVFDTATATKMAAQAMAGLNAGR